MSESTETKVKVKIINAYGKNFKELVYTLQMYNV